MIIAVEARQAQSLSALARANEIRCANAETKRMIRALASGDGRELVADILEDPGLPSLPISSLPVGRLLATVNRLGSAKTLRLLRHANINSWDRKVRDLTVRQRADLARRLRGDDTA